MTCAKSIRISVVVPVKNEERNLGGCLERLGRFNEVLVIDSGSDDRTCEIAREYRARVIEFRWDGKFPKKRNWVLTNCKLNNDWVLFLDADEYVSDEFSAEAEQAVAGNRFDGFWLNYTNYFSGRPLRHGDRQRKLALFKIGKGMYERIEEDNWSALDMEVHEHPIIDGPIGEISAPIEHRDLGGVLKLIEKHRNYASWEARRCLALRSGPAEHWDRLTSRQRTKYRNLDKWWFAWSYFAWTYFARRGFLDGAAGFATAFYKLWYFFTIRLLICESSEEIGQR